MGGYEQNDNEPFNEIMLHDFDQVPFHGAYFQPALRRLL
jgi:hypothetical protein